MALLERLLERASAPSGGVRAIQVRSVHVRSRARQEVVGRGVWREGGRKDRYPDLDRGRRLGPAAWVYASAQLRVDQCGPRAPADTHISDSQVDERGERARGRAREEMAPQVLSDQISHYLLARAEGVLRPGQRE